MMLYNNLFGASMLCGILCKYYASLIGAHDRCRSFLHVSNIYQEFYQTASFVQWLVAMYSANVVDSAMVGCFLHFYEMTPTPTKNTYPVVDCRSFTSPAQSASQNPLNTISLPPRHNLKPKVPFKYLIMCFMGIQCGKPAFDMIWLTVLTTNAISVIVASIAFMRDPTLALYETPSFFLCTFLNSSSESFNNLNSH